MWLRLILISFWLICYVESSILGSYIKSQLRNLTVNAPLHDGLLHPDYGLDVYGFLNKYDYPVEVHEVTTADGYVLTLQRIPYGRHGDKRKSFKIRPAVLLQHGLGSSGVDFINRGVNRSLGLILADSGYDVWLGNNRGTIWSKKHVTLDAEYNKTYWDFSFHECGYYDLPAMIDHILSVTSLKKIFYVGHSQGTTQFFAMGASKPSYNNKIALMTALAPVAYMKHLSSPILRPLASVIDILTPLADRIGLTHLEHTPEIAEFTKMFCRDGAETQKICALLIYLICGFNPEQMDMSFFPVLAYNAPGGLAMRMLTHYGQEINSGYFREFDYGKTENIKIYGFEVPPSYNVDRITAPVALYYSRNDMLAAVKDVERLAIQLPRLSKKHLLKETFFNHLDFIFAKDVHTILYETVLEHMAHYVDDCSSAISNKSIFSVVLVASLISFFTL